MDLRRASITADILNVLTDGKIHKMREIAEIVEVSETTVRNHIRSLSYRYPIETFRGGEKKGGVYLEKDDIISGHSCSEAELQFGAKVFGSLQRAELDEDEQKVLDTFIRIFAAHTEKEIL